MNKTSEIIITASIALMGVVFTASQAYIALSSHREIQEQKTTDKTFEFALDYRRIDIEEDRAKLHNYIISELTDWQREFLIHIKDEEAIKKLKNWGDDRNSNGATPFKYMSRTIFKLRIFYTDVAICVETKICDKEVSCRMFRRDINFFLEFYKPYLLIQSKRISHNLLSEIETYVDSCT